MEWVGGTLPQIDDCVTKVPIQEPARLGTLTAHR